VFQGGELRGGEAGLQQVDVIGHVWFAGSVRVKQRDAAKRRRRIAN
jgi:hypothetical protein